MSGGENNEKMIKTKKNIFVRFVVKTFIFIHCNLMNNKKIKGNWKNNEAKMKILHTNCT